MNTHFIFIGAPGSGKGTQSGTLVKKDGYNHISTGDLLRVEIANKSPLGLEAKKVMDAGQLVSDDMVIKLIKSNCDLSGKKYIFDGYPRNLAQAQTLDREVLYGSNYKAVYFHIDLPKIVQRLTNRRTCKDCGAIYNLISHKPKAEGVCDNCSGTNLMQRPDDKEEVIQKRLAVFKDNIDPVIDYYRSKGLLVTVDADRLESEVYKDIKSAL